MTLPIAEQDYQLWRHHPATEIFLRYLADYRDALRREALTRWEANALVLAEEQEMRGRVLTLGELIDLPFAAMAAFYQEPEDHADPRTENPSR